MKSALEVLREFFVMGLTAFGGPTAHVAFFRDRFVGVKKWLSDSDFADLLALCQFLPGPASSQLGLCIGWRRAGLPGALAAWTAFTLPSALALTIFAVILLNFGGEGIDGSAGWLRGLQIAVVAVIAKAAGIGNPKRIYVMRKQLQGRPPKRFLSLLGRLLEVEARLKRGAQPGDAFRDGLLG